MPWQMIDSWPMRVKGIKSKPGKRLSLNHSEYVIGFKGRILSSGE